MEDKFSYLKDIEDYQSFNVENKKALRKILMDMKDLISKQQLHIIKLENKIQQLESDKNTLSVDIMHLYKRLNGDTL